MRFGWTLLTCLFWPGTALLAQYDSAAETCVVTASGAFTWSEDEGKTSILQLQGPVAIELDKTTLSAKQAVVWITLMAGSVSDTRRFEVALIGNAQVTQPNGVVRSGPKLYVDARVRGSIRLVANSRSAINMHDSPLYQEASEIRPMILKGGQPSGRWQIEEPTLFPLTMPAPPQGPTTRPLRPVQINTRHFSTERSPDGKVVALLEGSITLVHRDAHGDLMELMADRAVIFTPFTSLTQLQPGEQLKSIEQAVTGVYLEGDVRMVRTPHDPILPEQRLTAERAYYDFTTDRAVLTDVVLYTRDPKNSVPILVRAQTVRQLSLNEYRAEKGEITTSTFHTPSYSIGASSIYIHQTEIGNEVTETRTGFVAKDAAFNIEGVPVFYLPYAAGSIAERNVMRDIGLSNQHAFGFGVKTQWGLFESLGQLPPKGTDVTYNADYFLKRGPAFGVSGKYVGGFVSETTLQPWSYSGDFHSYVVYDHGTDDLGKERTEVDPDRELRGRFYWEHQHFFPGDWQLQVTAGYISDPTFLEQWFNREFRSDAPHQTSVYAKHQEGTEALTFLVTAQPNDFATVADAYQEQAEVERLPEIGYQRIGDSLFNDQFTFFSGNTLSALKFRNSRYPLGAIEGVDQQDLGFAVTRTPRPQPDGTVFPARFQSPGIPSYGQTGTSESMDFRGDFRQELDWPVTLDRFRLVPYVVGRYTQYSEGPDGGTPERAYAAAGIRTTTAFWRVDDSVESAAWDLHRLRHVIEPEFNVFSSVQSQDRDNLFIYDEPIDAINDITAIQFALNQRWQTKRGGPGQWRSVDYFTLNLQANYFINKPSDKDLDPRDFRGLFYSSMPEASIPRDGLNAYMTWRVSDAVTVLSDIYYNADENVLSAASIGVSVRQDPRLAYYIGLRHIGVDVERLIQNGPAGWNTFIFQSQDLFLFSVDYQLTALYRINITEGYDLAQHRNDRSTVSFIRRFDRFYAAISFRVDELDNESAVFFNLWPEGMQPGAGSEGLHGVMSQ